MNYPKNYSHGKRPEEICVGDLVWWNEGVCVGFIEELMEEHSDYEKWGLAEPSVALTNLHPFEANDTKHKQHIGSVVSGGTVVCSTDDLECEGIGLLTEHERAELEWAVGEARSKVEVLHRELSFCVSALMELESGEEFWHFSFVDQECQIIEAVSFPFRPNTRTEYS